MMPNYLAKAIANEFLKKRASPIVPSQMYLQKLVYIAHGWNLAVNKEPLITEKPEAWDNGPVYRSIWDHIRDYGYLGNNCALVDAATGNDYAVKLADDEKSVIDHVWFKYGERNAKELSDMTHEPNTPWSKAYFNRGRNSSLKDDEIQEHYTQLALAGRKKI